VQTSYVHLKNGDEYKFERCEGRGAVRIEFNGKTTYAKLLHVPGTQSGADLPGTSLSIRHGGGFPDLPAGWRVCGEREIRSYATFGHVKALVPRAMLVRSSTNPAWVVLVTAGYGAQIPLRTGERAGVEKAAEVVTWARALHFLTGADDLHYHNLLQGCDSLRACDLVPAAKIPAAGQLLLYPTAEAGETCAADLAGELGLAKKQWPSKRTMAIVIYKVLRGLLEALNGQNAAATCAQIAGEVAGFLELDDGRFNPFSPSWILGTDQRMLLRVFCGNLAALADELEPFAADLLEEPSFGCGWAGVVERKGELREETVSTSLRQEGLVSVRELRNPVQDEDVTTLKGLITRGFSRVICIQEAATRELIVAWAKKRGGSERIPALNKEEVVYWPGPASAWKCAVL
jgi:hypothetical protein